MSFYSNLPTTGGPVLQTPHPTIFEILSSQEIDTLLPASIRYILTNYIVARHPSRFTLALNNLFPEWFELVTKSVIEYYHLLWYDATFVDRFYGLRCFNGNDKILVRSQNENIGDEKIQKSWPRGLQLTTKQRYVLLLDRVVLPYIRGKFDLLHEKIVSRDMFADDETIEEQHGEGNKYIISFKDRMRRYIKQVFVLMYPKLKKLIYILNLMVKLGYLTGKIGSISILEYISEIEYSTATLPLESSTIVSNKSQTTISSQDRPKHINNTALKHKGLELLSHFRDISTYTGSQLFPIFIFMLKVYQWWTTQDLTSKLHKKLNNLDKDIPVPRKKTVKTDNENEKKGKVVLYKGLECPICHEEMRNACVIESGYAMCYPCAITYLTTHEGKCPITDRKLLGCRFNTEVGNWEVVTGIRKLLI